MEGRCAGSGNLEERLEAEADRAGAGPAHPDGRQAGRAGGRGRQGPSWAGT